MKPAGLARRSLGILMAGIGLAACSGPTAPLVGEWRGPQPGIQVNVPKEVDLTLNGEPGAPTGSYYITSIDPDPNLLVGHDEQEWGGTWVRTDRTINGEPVSIFTLQNLPPNLLGTWALEPDGRLHAVDQNGLPDTTPLYRLYVLSRVAHPRYPR